MTDSAATPNEESVTDETDRVKSPGPSFVALLNTRLDAVDLENLGYSNPPNEEELAKLKEEMVYLGPMTDTMKRLLVVRLDQKAALDKIHVEIVELDGALSVDLRLGRTDRNDARFAQLLVLLGRHELLHREDQVIRDMSILETASVYPDYNPGDDVFVTPDWELYHQPEQESIESEQNPVEDMVSLLSHGGYEKFAEGLRELFGIRR